MPTTMIMQVLVLLYYDDHEDLYNLKENEVAVLLQNIVSSSLQKRGITCLFCLSPYLIVKIHIVFYHLEEDWCRPVSIRA